MNILLVINEIFFLSKVTVKFDIFTVKIPPSRFDTFAFSSLCHLVEKELNFSKEKRIQKARERMWIRDRVFDFL